MVRGINWRWSQPPRSDHRARTPGPPIRARVPCVTQLVPTCIRVFRSVSSGAVILHTSFSSGPRRLISGIMMDHSADTRQCRHDVIAYGMECLFQQRPNPILNVTHHSLVTQDEVSRNPRRVLVGQRAFSAEFFHNSGRIYIILRRYTNGPISASHSTSVSSSHHPAGATAASRPSFATTVTRALVAARPIPRKHRYSSCRPVVAR